MVEGTSLKFQPFERVLRLAEHDVLNSCPSLQLTLDCDHQMAASPESTSHEQSQKNVSPLTEFAVFSRASSPSVHMAAIDEMR